MAGKKEDQKKRKALRIDRKDDFNFEVVEVSPDGKEKAIYTDIYPLCADQALIWFQQEAGL